MMFKRIVQDDWIELAATILLSAATIVAAWSAYQSTRWSGIQSLDANAAAARRIEATQHNAVFAAQVQIDAMAWMTYLEQLKAGDEKGMVFLRERFRDEFAPAFEAWIALVPPGDIPPGTPFDLAEYQPQARLDAQRLNDEADALSAEAAEANRIGDDFVLVAVIMASVLFCAGVATKVSSRGLRLSILFTGGAVFLGGTAFMLSLPQTFGA